MIKTQHPAQSFLALNRLPVRWNDLERFQQLIVDALVVAFLKMVYLVFAQCVAKRPLTEKDHSVKAFLLY